MTALKIILAFSAFSFLYFSFFSVLSSSACLWRIVLRVFKRPQNARETCRHLPLDQRYSPRSILPSLSLLVWYCGDWSHLSIAESTFHILIELRLELLLGMGRYDTFASTSFYASCWLPFCHSSSLAFEEGREREGEGEEKGRKAEGVSCLSTYHTVHSFTMSANLASVECLPLSLALSVLWKVINIERKKERIYNRKREMGLCYKLCSYVDLKPLTKTW